MINIIWMKFRTILRVGLRIDFFYFEILDIFKLYIGGILGSGFNKDKEKL